MAKATVEDCAVGPTDEMKKASCPLLGRRVLLWELVVRAEGEVGSNV